MNSWGPAPRDRRSPSRWAVGRSATPSPGRTDQHWTIRPADDLIRDAAKGETAESPAPVGREGHEFDAFVSGEVKDRSRHRVPECRGAARVDTALLQALRYTMEIVLGLLTTELGETFVVTHRKCHRDTGHRRSGS